MKVVFIFTRREPSIDGLPSADKIRHATEVGVRLKKFLAKKEIPLPTARIDAHHACVTITGDAQIYGLFKTKNKKFTLYQNSVQELGCANSEPQLSSAHIEILRRYGKEHPVLECPRDAAVEQLLLARAQFTANFLLRFANLAKQIIGGQTTTILLYGHVGRVRGALSLMAQKPISKEDAPIKKGEVVLIEMEFRFDNDETPKLKKAMGLGDLSQSDPIWTLYPSVFKK